MAHICIIIIFIFILYLDLLLNTYITPFTDIIMIIIIIYFHFDCSICLHFTFINCVIFTYAKAEAGVTTVVVVV